MNYNEHLIKKVVDGYCKATGFTEFTKDDAIAWAIHNDQWKPSLKSQVELLRQELSVAMRAVKKVVKGRKVRQYNCIRRKLSDGYVQTVWAHIDVATEPFMEQSIGHQRQGLAGIAYSLHSTIVYWKEKNPDSTIEASFDFTNDNADRDAALAAGQVIEDDELDLEELEATDMV
jgi:hypothetical protein